MSADLVAHFKAMARNNRWANHRLHEACMALGPGEFTAARTGFFPSLSATLNHIHAIDLYYIDALVSGGLGRAAWRNHAEMEDAAALAAAQAATDRRLIAFCEALPAADCERRVPMDREEDGIFEERIVDILAHLFQHQIHHRGQAHAMLSGTSVKPPQLDEFYLAYDRANDIDEALRERNRR